MWENKGRIHGPLALIVNSDALFWPKMGKLAWLDCATPKFNLVEFCAVYVIVIVIIIVVCHFHFRLFRIFYHS